MARHTLNERMERLFDLLKSIEEQGLRLTKRDFEQRVMSEVGYKQITWATYRSKYLDGVLIYLDDDDPVLLRVRGALLMSQTRFAHVMTQTKTGGAAIPSNEDDWRTAVRRLAMLGRERNFMLPTADRALLLGLFDKQQSLF
jgi:hypothetical protein